MDLKISVSTVIIVIILAFIANIVFSFYLFNRCNFLKNNEHEPKSRNTTNVNVNEGFTSPTTGSSITINSISDNIMPVYKCARVKIVGNFINITKNIWYNLFSTISYGEYYPDYSGGTETEATLKTTNENVQFAIDSKNNLNKFILNPDGKYKVTLNYFRAINGNIPNNTMVDLKLQTDKTNYVNDTYAFKTNIYNINSNITVFITGAKYIIPQIRYRDADVKVSEKTITTTVSIFIERLG